MPGFPTLNLALLLGHFNHLLWKGFLNHHIVIFLCLLSCLRNHEWLIHVFLNFLLIEQFSKMVERKRRRRIQQHHLLSNVILLGQDLVVLLIWGKITFCQRRQCMNLDYYLCMHTSYPVLTSIWLGMIFMLILSFRVSFFSFFIHFLNIDLIPCTNLIVNQVLSNSVKDL
jgi:hypothetical protein